MRSIAATSRGLAASTLEDHHERICVRLHQSGLLSLRLSAGSRQSACARSRIGHRSAAGARLALSGVRLRCCSACKRLPVPERISEYENRAQGRIRRRWRHYLSPQRPRHLSYWSLRLETTPRRREDCFNVGHCRRPETFRRPSLGEALYENCEVIVALPGIAHMACHQGVPHVVRAALH